ncbi:hypothetical protein B296_00055724 [Ensete ventricosum]|uniref:Ferritin n=1 Tax=Ensete ventricosum TaxID=4639 RepID=A0A426XYD2_ENSVE|nr:hypothetical protein B296_00055724 [Ensete ventricosum]
MLLKAPPQLALLFPSSADPSPLPGNPSLRSYLKLPNGRARGGPVFAAAGGDHAITGVIFEPFEELKSNRVSLVPVSPDQSLARQKYADDCEAAINLQIKWPMGGHERRLEREVDLVGIIPRSCLFVIGRNGIIPRCALASRRSLHKRLERSRWVGVRGSCSYQWSQGKSMGPFAHVIAQVAIPGWVRQQFFRESSQEERDHAEKLMKYQSERFVVSISAMELALSLEKLTNEKLLNLHCVSDPVAQKHNDAQMADFIESEFLGEQVKPHSLILVLALN